MSQVAIRLGASLLIFAAAWSLWTAIRIRQLSRGNGESTGLPGYIRGKAALLYFSSSSCAPCRTIQRPAVERLRSELGDRLQIVEVDAVSRPDLAERWSVFTVPTTILIDAGGKARAVNSGVASSATLAAQAAQAL
jgi:thioredoxin 1